MCIAPNTLSDGSKTACHKCWQCQQQAIDDWAGRNIAESKTSVATNAVTLTYGRSEDNEVDHLHAAILTYSDVQKYLKLLRRHGYPVRYFVTGEYGTTKGRAHWHIILHWQKEVPQHELGTRFMHYAHKAGGNNRPVIDPNTGEHMMFWPGGMSFWDTAAEGAVRYNCKYILKDMGDDARQGHLAMSKKPPLGAAYFEKLATEYVAQCLAPQTLTYTFAESKRRKLDGSLELTPYRLKDRSAELFLRKYVDTWAAQRPNEKLPKSEVVALFLSPNTGDRDRIRERLAEMGPPEGWTPAQRVQVSYDLARLDHLEWVDGKAGLVDEKSRIKTKLNVWDALEQWERKYFGVEEQQQGQQQQLEVQQRVERVLAEVYARQGGRVEFINEGNYDFNIDWQDGSGAGPGKGRVRRNGR